MLTSPRSYRLLYSLQLMPIVIAVTGCGWTSPQTQAPELPSCWVPIGNSPTRGPSAAAVTIVEFGDFECPYCGEVEPVLKQLDLERPGLRWVWKEFPLSSIHPRALPCASAAECAGAQGHFWEMHDLLYQNQAAQSDNDLVNYAGQIGLNVSAWQQCLTSDAPVQRIAADEADATRARVDGTPSFFINGTALIGSRPLPDFLAAVDAATPAAGMDSSLQAAYYADHEGQGCL